MDLSEFIQKYKFEGNIMTPVGDSVFILQFTHYNSETNVVRGIWDDERGESVIIGRIISNELDGDYLVALSQHFPHNQGYMDINLLEGRITNNEGPINFKSMKRGMYGFSSNVIPIDGPVIGYIDIAAQLKFPDMVSN